MPVEYQNHRTLAILLKVNGTVFPTVRVARESAVACLKSPPRATPFFSRRTILQITELSAARYRALKPRLPRIAHMFRSFTGCSLSRRSAAR